MTKVLPGDSTQHVPLCSSVELQQAEPTHQALSLIALSAPPLAVPSRLELTPPVHLNEQAGATLSPASPPPTCPAFSTTLDSSTPHPPVLTLLLPVPSPSSAGPCLLLPSLPAPTFAAVLFGTSAPNSPSRGALRYVRRPFAPGLLTLRGLYPFRARGPSASLSAGLPPHFPTLGWLAAPLPLLPNVSIPTLSFAGSLPNLRPLAYTFAPSLPSCSASDLSVSLQGPTQPDHPPPPPYLALLVASTYLLFTEVPFPLPAGQKDLPVSPQGPVQPDHLLPPPYMALLKAATCLPFTEVPLLTPADKTQCPGGLPWGS